MAVLVTLLALVVASCTRRPDADDWEPAVGRGPTRVETMRGMLHERQPGRLTLVPCGRNLHLEVEDRTGGPLATARAELGPPIFVEMRVERGVRSDDWRTPEDRVLVAQALLRAVPAGEGDPCSRVLPPGQVRASGNEPFWSVFVAPDRIEWTEPDLSLAFPPATPRAEDGRRTWSTQVSGPGLSHRLGVVVREEPCRDSMSGAWHALTAEVTLDDRVLHGCAWEG